MVEDVAPSAENGRTWLKWVLRGVVAMALFGGVWLGRWVMLELSVRSTVRVVRVVAAALPEKEGRTRKARDDLLFPLWPLDSLPEEGLSSDKDDKSAAPGMGAVGTPLEKAPPPPIRPLPLLGPRPTDSRASPMRVLDWAAQEIIPRGVTRAAAGGLPAGIELYGVGPLGIGLRDGDRLVTVDGISVVEREQVIGAVLGARSRRAESMTAGLVRRTKEGPIHFKVVVEQPYPEHVVLRESGQTDERGETEGSGEEGDEPTSRPLTQ